MANIQNRQGRQSRNFADFPQESSPKPPETMLSNELFEISSIYRYIKEGWQRSFKFQWEATGYFFEEIKPEQLITVNIAQSIVDDQKHFGNPFILKLEEKTNIAFNECFELMKKIATNEKLRFIKFDREFHNSSRNGKFDIVLYTKAINSHKQLNTKYVIETKGFNQKRSNILKDVERICELVSLIDRVGNSSFVAGFVTFAKSYRKLSQYDDAQKKHLKWLDSLYDQDKKNNAIDRVVFEISSYWPIGDQDIDHAHCFIGTILAIKSSNRTYYGG